MRFTPGMLPADAEREQLLRTLEARSDELAALRVKRQKLEAEVLYLSKALRRQARQRWQGRAFWVACGVIAASVIWAAVRS